MIWQAARRHHPGRQQKSLAEINRGMLPRDQRYLFSHDAQKRLWDWNAPSSTEDLLCTHDPMPSVPDLRLDSLSEVTFSLEQVIPSLQIHPKLRAVAKVAAQSQRSLGRDCPLAVEYRRNSA
jgi:hypothetical protein